MAPEPASREPSVVVITGAGRGIGAGCAQALASRGNTVVVADRDLDLATETADRIRASGGKALPWEVDVRDWASVDAMFNGIVSTLGAIDVAIANAGIGDYSSLHDGDPARWRVVVETNLLGVLHTVRGAFPHMVRRRRGHIVLMASIAGRQTWIGEPVYITTKWGVVGLGQVLRREGLEHNVRVTLIEPGMVDTPLVRSTEEGRSELERFAALSIEDVANAVVFAVEQPEGVGISELLIQPVGPELA